jgi:hypothetical protein
MTDRIGLERGAEYLDCILASPTAVAHVHRGDGRPDASVTDPAPQFRSVSLLQLVNAEFPVPEALLAPWLCAQQLAQIHAWRGTGKTFFSLGVVVSREVV